MEINIDELAEKIALRLDPNAVLTARDVAAILGVSQRYVTEVLAKRDGFPQPSRAGKPRWLRWQITDYVASTVPKRTGRPRKPLSHSLGEPHKH